VEENRVKLKLKGKALKIDLVVTLFHVQKFVHCAQ